MVAWNNSQQPNLLDRAITTLLCALAFDEALQSGASPADLAELRRHWVDDAQSIVDEAERRGLLNDEETDE